MKARLAEIIGWYGTLALLFAYALASFKFIQADGFSYQFLNLTCAIGIIVIAAYKKVYQSVVLNIFWGGVALIALMRILAN
jgi:hypothetical protein